MPTTLPPPSPLVDPPHSFLGLPDVLLCAILSESIRHSRAPAITAANLHGTCSTFQRLIDADDWACAARSCGIRQQAEQPRSVTSWRATVAAVLSCDRALAAFATRPPASNGSTLPGLRCPQSQPERQVVEELYPGETMAALSAKERAWLAWFNRFAEGTLHVEQITCLHGWGWQCGGDVQCVHLHSSGGECVGRAISAGPCLSSGAESGSRGGERPLVCAWRSGSTAEGFERLAHAVTEFRARARLAARMVVVDKPAGASGRQGTPAALSRAAAEAIAKLYALDRALCAFVRPAVSGWAQLEAACDCLALPPCFIVVPCVDALMGGPLSIKKATRMVGSMADRIARLDSKADGALRRVVFVTHSAAAYETFRKAVLSVAFKSHHALSLSRDDLVGADGASN